MSRRTNDGNITGLKQDKFRNSQFEYEEEMENSGPGYRGVSKATSNTINGKWAENRGRRSAMGQWSGSPFEDGESSVWSRRQGQDSIYSNSFDRGQRRYGDAQIFHDKGNFQGKGPRGYKRSDESIFEDVCSTLYLSPSVDASDVEVSVKDGVVYLKGTISDRQMKRNCEFEIENISGVKDVQNQLTFKGAGKDLH